MRVHLVGINRFSERTGWFEWTCFVFFPSNFRNVIDEHLAHQREAARALTFRTPSLCATFLTNMMNLLVLFALLASVVAFAPVSRLNAMSRTSVKMMVNVGDAVPNVVFKARVRDETIPGSNPFKWKDVTSADLFKGKRAVVFALPGGTLQLTESIVSKQ